MPNAFPAELRDTAPQLTGGSNKYRVFDNFY